MHFVLGDDRRVLGVSARIRLALDRQVIRQRVAGDDHRGRVDPVLAAQPLEAQRNEGKTSLAAVHEACLLRFRPIMMTTMAALFGGLPIALGYGATQAHAACLTYLS